MPKTAYLFPGQGSQFVGMGRDLVERYETAAQIFEAADVALGFSLSGVMFGTGGDPDVEAQALKQTQNTQPALFVHSMAAFEVLSDHGLSPDVAAGHSLGEYSALASARAISFEEGLRLVRLRGELMAQAGRTRPGTMAAVLGVDDDVVTRICREVSADGSGVVEPANFNAPGQIVISGDERAVKEALERLRGAGARKTIPLSVSGAFHSPLMEEAREALASALADVEISPPRCPVYTNVSARPVTNPDEIRTHLLQQLTSPVRWTETIQQMHADQTDSYCEVGAGNVLVGLVRRTLGRDVRTEAVGTVETLEACIQQG